MALNLGCHVISPTCAQPVHVMEVVPSLLARRAFPPLNTHIQVLQAASDRPTVYCLALYANV